MGRRRHGYMTVEVDLSEALEEIDDASLLEEVKERKLSLGRDDFDPMDDLRDIYAALLRGRPAEALSILDRLIRPKWNTTQACEMDLARMKADVSGAKEP
ncbi:hypothetical protein ABIE93_005997 [Bradyrhizobium elkanii]